MRLAALSGLALAANLALTPGCKTATKSLDSDSGDCEATCTSALDLIAADGSTEFTLTISGEGFTNLQIGCPDGVRAGGSTDAEVACDGDTVHVTLAGAGFPTPINVVAAIDNETYTDAQALSPDWTEEPDCGVTCNTGEATFEMP
jgi:hypothetical protein